jgi:hypothetical protein
MNFLRQSTAVDIGIGPFVDATDGVTAETGLTISQADVRLKKNNGAWAQVNDNTSATHEENGWYEKELDATDTNTCGILLIAVHESGALPVWHEFQVVEEAVYDALFAASALGYVANAPVNVAQFGGSNGTFASGRPEVNASHWAGTAVGSTTVRADLINIAGAAVSTTTAQLGVNVVQVSGDGTAADNLETAYDDTAGAVRWAGIVDQGTAQSATGTTLVLRAAAAFADDELIGATIQITGGSTGVGQSRLITDYVSATDTATVEAWTTTPSGTITYKIYGTAPSSGGSGLDAAGVRAAVGLASANLDTQLSTIDNFLDTEVAAVLAAVDTEIGTLQTSVNTIDDFLDTEMAALTTAVADLPTNAELATALGTADDAVLAQVALVKAKTDSLTFTVANVLDANIQRINDVTITGDGQPGTEFGV